MIPRGGSNIKSIPKINFLRSLCLGIGFLLLTLQAGAVRAQDATSIPRIIFTKTLKGSSPEYFALSIDANGKATYDSHKLEDPAAPQPLQISTETTTKIFSLARSLGNFRGIELESRHKVADMGMKTLSYQDAGETNKVQFNYTENHTAEQLAVMLEKIGNVEERISSLEYAMKYDHLDLPQILRQIEYGMNENIFLEARLMIPTLEKIETDTHYLHLAQARAQEIEQRIQSGK